MLIEYKSAKSEKDLQGILTLQKKNLARQLDTAEIISQGFVTVDHTYEQLKKLNDIEQHIIAKDGDKVIGYILAMTAASRHDIPVLVPMFDLFDSIRLKGKKIADFRYMVIGQVCVDKVYRGQGVFDNCYKKYREQFSPEYDFAITEIAANNLRSLHAHTRVGFRELQRHTGSDHTEWIIVIWEWNENFSTSGQNLF